MRRPWIIFREAPRFLPIRQRELLEGFRPVLRTVIVYGPPLGLLALWVVHRFGGGAAIPLRLVIGLPLAPLAFGLIFALPILFSRIPALAPRFLNRWHLRPGGVIRQNGLVSEGIPWTAIDALTIEETPDEITLHLDARSRGRTTRHSLTCLRAETAAESIAFLADAIRDKRSR